MKELSKPKIAAGLALAGALLIALTPTLSGLYGNGARLAVGLGLLGLVIAAKALLRPAPMDRMLMMAAGGAALLLAVIAGGASLWLLLPGAVAILGAGLWLRAMDKPAGFRAP